MAIVAYSQCKQAIPEYGLLIGHTTRNTPAQGEFIRLVEFCANADATRDGRDERHRAGHSVFPRFQGVSGGAQEPVSSHCCVLRRAIDIWLLGARGMERSAPNVDGTKAVA